MDLSFLYVICARFSASFSVVCDPNTPKDVVIGVLPNSLRFSRQVKRDGVLSSPTDDASRPERTTPRPPLARLPGHSRDDHVLAPADRCSEMDVWAAPPSGSPALSATVVELILRLGGERPMWGTAGRNESLFIHYEILPVRFPPCFDSRSPSVFIGGKADIYLLPCGND